LQEALKETVGISFLGCREANDDRDVRQKFRLVFLYELNDEARCRATEPADRYE